jgi:hypothetical protein
MKNQQGVCHVLKETESALFPLRGSRDVKMWEYRVATDEQHDGEKKNSDVVRKEFSAGAEVVDLVRNGSTAKRMKHSAAKREDHCHCPSGQTGES